MTRRLASPARRLLRSPAQPRRHDHAGDVALLAPREARELPDFDRGHAARTDTERALQSLVEENAALARELGRVQQRGTQWRDECIVQAERLEAALMRARGANIVKDTQLASLRDALDALHKRAATWLTNEELVRRLSDLRARNRSLECELAESRRALDALRDAGDARAPAANDEAPAAPAIALAARKVLCVGGRARQVPVYRDLVERGGGHFEHVEAASDDCLGRLSRLLAEADLVILQPGYASQGACRVVEAHCARTGTRCVRLDKTCALAFAHGLAQAGDDATPHTEDSAAHES